MVETRGYKDVFNGFSLLWKICSLFILQKNGHSYIQHENPDIICVQETKCEKEKIPKEVNLDGYHTYWLSGDTEGYSGVGMYTKEKPINVTYGIGKGLLMTS